MMNLWDKVTGNDMKRDWKVFDSRVEKLPADYQTAWAEITANLWQYSDVTGRNLTPIVEGVLGLLEETAAEGQSINEVLGGDIKGFCAAVAGEEGAITYRDKWRDQLNRTVAKKLSALSKEAK